jgi:hypothetical protein
MGQYIKSASAFFPAAFCIQRGSGDFTATGRKSTKKSYNSYLRINTPLSGMKLFLPIVVLVCSSWSRPVELPHGPAAPLSPQAANSASAIPEDAGTRKARAVIEEGIQALGGSAYLDIHDRETEGKGYSLHHGRPTGAGTVFWSFFEFPDKERVELTKERDVTELYIGNKGYEITFRGVHPIEEKDLTDYLRRRRFSLDTVLRTWVNDPSVVIIYVGTALAGQYPSDEIKLINSKDESVSLYFDLYTHLPLKKSFQWRDPVDRQKNTEEEIYENYRKVAGGIMAPYNVTRFFNGDMANQRFITSVAINQQVDPAMFDPNSGYNPNKPAKKH